MKRNRKILDEARTSVAVVSTSEPPQRPRRRGRVVKMGASLHVRREVLWQMASQYREASWARKRVVGGGRLRPSDGLSS